MTATIRHLKNSDHAATSTRMTWQNAVTIADRWIAENLPLNLKGKILVVPDFDNDATALYFNPDRPKLFHDMVNQAIGRTARKRGAKIRHDIVTVDCFHGPDSPDDRAAFIATRYRIEDRL